MDPQPGRVQRAAASMRKLRWPVVWPASAIFLAFGYLDAGDWVRPVVFYAVILPFLLFPAVETGLRNAREGYNSDARGGET